jgi:hypothetical protein
MNKLLPSIRITDPAFIEGRVIGAFSIQSNGMRHLFHGFSATLFPATPSSRRGR